jgi:hypothetical protein
MLTTRIYLAAMSRADLPVAQMKQMPNFYFYVDEFQSFANATFANILSEARKYHLNLIIAHQYVEQMEDDVKNAVFGNVGTTVAFRVGPFDAEALEPIFAPTFEATDLVNLGKFQVYLSLMIDGIGSRPFSALTLPPIAEPEESYKDMAIAASRRNFSGRREEVERLVTELHATERKPKQENGKGKNGGNGRKNGERQKPNFENTILTKLREQQAVQTPPEQTAAPKPPQIPHQVKEKPQPQSSPTPPMQASSHESLPAPDMESGHSLDALRAVLKRISDEEKASLAEDKPVSKNGNKQHKNGKRPKHSKPRHEQKKVPHQKSGGGDLKSALAAAIGDAPSAPQPEARKVESVVQQSQPQQQPELIRESAPQPRPQPESSDEVSSKELERMMRVTTSDKPPL